MKTCSACTRHLLVDELRCPFCGAAQPSTSAPHWTRYLTVGLALHACACTDGIGSDTGAGEASASEEEAGDDGGETLSDDGASTNPNPTSVESHGEGEDSIGSNDDDAGEGSTYAGPDEDTMIWGETETETDTFGEESTTVATMDTTGTTGTTDTTTDDGDTTTGGPSVTSESGE